MLNAILPKSHSAVELFGIVFVILISLGIRVVFKYLDKEYKLENGNEKIRFLIGFVFVLFGIYSFIASISFTSDYKKMVCIENNYSKIEKLQKEEDYSLEDSIWEVCVGAEPEKPDYEYDLRGGNYY